MGVAIASTFPDPEFCLDDSITVIIPRSIYMLLCIVGKYTHLQWDSHQVKQFESCLTSAQSYSHSPIYWGKDESESSPEAAGKPLFLSRAV
jgi:hypothetical protein